MKTKIPLYVISMEPSKTVGYELKDLTTYSTDGDVIEEKDQKNYDNLFVERLCIIEPVYNIRDFLDFHYRDCEDKNLFLDHMEHVVLPLLRRTRVSPPKGSIAYDFKDKLAAQFRPYAEVFEKWILSNSAKIKVLDAPVIAIAFFIKELGEYEGYEFKKIKMVKQKEVREFIEKEQIMNPNEGSLISWKTVCNHYSKMLYMKNDEFEQYKKEFKKEFRYAEKLLNKHF